MAAGAGYDLGFGLAMLLAPESAGRILGIATPVDPLYVRFAGLLLLVLAAMYSLPALNPSRFRAVVLVAVLARLGGCLFLAAAWRSGRETAFLGLALADLFLGILHAALLARAGPSSS